MNYQILKTTISYQILMIWIGKNEADFKNKKCVYG